MENSREFINLQFEPSLYSKLPKDLVSKNFEFLIKLFKKDYSTYFPTRIANEADLLFLTHLSQSLQALKDCKGFEDHVQEFKNGVDTNYFVTTIAAHLMSQATNLILEPHIDGVNKKADILATIKSTDVFFECKCPNPDFLSAIESEHEEMYESLSSSIIKPCDVSITYSETLTKEQIEKLGRFLRSKLPLVTGEGEILNYKNVKVEVTNVREQFNDIGNIRLTRLWDNYHEKSLQPGSIINRNGVAMMFFKSNVTAFNNIESQIKNSKNKVPKNKPIVAVIKSENLPGKLIQNVEFVKSLFNEKKYTSFNGVLFVRHSYSFQRLIEYQFHYINNPFARNPIPQISEYFKSTIIED